MTTATLTAWYTPSIPATVTAAYTQTAEPAIGHLTPLCQEAAARAGISWKLLAACDWMQCAADPRRSPV